VLAVAGEALVDLVDEGNRGSYAPCPGGSPFNVAIALARLGHPTALLARLAQDRFGRLLRRHADRHGVILDAAATAQEPTSLAVVSLDDAGGAEYDFYINGTADWQWTSSELALPPDTLILHFGSLASWLPRATHLSPSSRPRLEQRRWSPTTPTCGHTCSARLRAVAR
jgi:fructokinase